ncbi:MAG: winged helix-turn-helix domain-containing protein [Acidobacteria bacterium]|nr:winged helix-turn-helix domain-containing protein [Acidobacteriota bacterium]
MVKKKHYFEFGEFQLEVKERALLRRGEPLPLTPKAFDTLVALVENAGSLVEKDELMRAVWPDAFVEEGGLARNISVLRKVLGPDATGQPYIETVPKRGYRFTAQVRERMDESAEFIFEQSAISQTVEIHQDYANAEIMAIGLAQVREPITTATASPALPAVAPPLVTWKAKPVRLGLALVLLALSLALLYFLSENRKKPFDKSNIKSIAVLPFKRLDTSDDNERLGIGMADTLITRLSHLRQVSVRPTRDVMRYENGEADIAAAGKALDADAVLDGSIQRVGERLRVTVRLVATASKAQIWAAQFDEKFTGIFAVQDAIAEQVAQALSLNLSATEQQLLTKNYTANVEAYQAYLKGRYFWNKRRREDQERAIEYFEQAIGISPDYALAYSGLADAYSTSANLARVTARRTALYKLAKAAALKAIAIDRNLAEAHASLGLILRNADWHWAESERALKLAIELSPNYATAHQYYALLLVTLGRLDEALSEIATAQQLDPLSLVINADQALIYIFAHRPQQAIAVAKKALEMDMQFQRLQRILLWAYEEAGMFDEATRAGQSMLKIEGGDPIFPMSILGYIYAVSGQRDQAVEVVEKLLTQTEQISPASVQAAAVCAALGERDRAFALIEKALEARDDRLLWIKVDPRFINLRADKRYPDLLRRMSLPL